MFVLDMERVEVRMHVTIDLLPLRSPVNEVSPQVSNRLLGHGLRQQVCHRDLPLPLPELLLLKKHFPLPLHSLSSGLESRPSVSALGLRPSVLVILLVPFVLLPPALSSLSSLSSRLPPLSSSSALSLLILPFLLL